MSNLTHSAKSPANNPGPQLSGTNLAHAGDHNQRVALRAVRVIDDLIQDVLCIPVYTENDAAAAAIGEMQFGLGLRYRSFCNVLITAALSGGLVIDGHYFRGAHGRSGEIGWMRASNSASDKRELQQIVSLSGLYGRLSEHGYRVVKPRDLLRLAPAAQAVVGEWIAESARTLSDAFVAINCLIDPQAILIGGRLPAALIDRLAASLNERVASRSAHIPAIAPVARASLSDDAPAMGAAILPFNNRLLPSRYALLKTA